MDIQKLLKVRKLYANKELMLLKCNSFKKKELVPTELLLNAMLVLVMATALSAAFAAADYPTRPIRFVVPSTAGGAGDIFARTIGQSLAEKFGKQVGGDIIANKKTFLLIKALEKAKGKDRKELDYWLAATKFKKAEKVAAVTAIYDRLGIEALTRKKIDGCFGRAYSLLEKISTVRNTAEIRQYAGVLMDRQH